MKFLYCSKCSWMSGPHDDDVMWAGPGGGLGCPVCRHRGENYFLSVHGSVSLIDVAGWEPEIWRLKQLLEFYYKCPTVEDIDAYLKSKDRLKGYSPPKEEVIRRRELILGLFERIKHRGSLGKVINDG